MKCQIDDLVPCDCSVTSFQKGLKICQSKLQVADIQLTAKCDLPISLLVRYIQCICDDGTQATKWVDYTVGNYKTVKTSILSLIAHS